MIDGNAWKEENDHGRARFQLNFYNELNEVARMGVKASSYEHKWRSPFNRTNQAYFGRRSQQDW